MIIHPLRRCCSHVSCQREALCSVSIRDHLKHQQGTWTSYFTITAKILSLFHLIPTGWILYFTHWLPKLKTWLKMNWLEFNKDKINAQGWKTTEIGRDSPSPSLYEIFHQGMLEFQRTDCDCHLTSVRLC